MIVFLKRYPWNAEKDLILPKRKYTFSLPLNQHQRRSELVQDMSSHFKDNGNIHVNETALIQNKIWQTIFLFKVENCPKTQYCNTGEEEKKYSKEKKDFMHILEMIFFCFGGIFDWRHECLVWGVWCWHFFYAELTMTSATNFIPWTFFCCCHSYFAVQSQI